MRVWEVAEPLVKKIDVMFRETCDTYGPEGDVQAIEVLYFAMWCVFLGFTTARDPVPPKEHKALNEAMNNIFNMIALDDLEEASGAEIDLTSGQHKMIHEFSSNHMIIFNDRVQEYNVAFNKEKAVAFGAPDDELFVPETLMLLFLKYAYGDEAKVQSTGDLRPEFVGSFTSVFAYGTTEVSQYFEPLKI